MVQKINPYPALGHNRSPPYYVFSKDTILGSVPSISSEVLRLSSSVHAEKLQVSAALCCKILRYTLLQNGLNVCRIVFSDSHWKLSVLCSWMDGKKHEKTKFLNNYNLQGLDQLKDLISFNNLNSSDVRIGLNNLLSASYP